MDNALPAPPPPYSAVDPRPRFLHALSAPVPDSVESGKYNSAVGTRTSLEVQHQGSVRAGSRDARKKGHRTGTDASLNKALYEAVCQRNIETVRILLQSRADINWFPSGSKPALTVAASNQDTEIIKLILEKGYPDLEACPYNRKSALYTAVCNGSVDDVRLLLQHGASANSRPSGAQPALYKAYTRSHREITWLLLDDKEIDVDATPPGGCTILYKAAEKEDRDVVEALLRMGASVDIRPPGGVTAMYRVADRGDVPTTDLLLRFGARVDAKPPGGTTALWHAVKKSKVELIRLLLRYSADTNAKPPGGKTALELAAKNDKTQDRIILNLLLESDQARDASGP